MEPLPPKPKIIHRKRRSKPIKPKSPRAIARAAVLDRNRLVEATLLLSHTRNGQVYGPGHVRIPRGLLMELQRDEEQAVKGEERFLGVRAKIITSERGRTREVPPETFDTSLNQAEPAFTQHGAQRS